MRIPLPHELPRDFLIQSFDGDAVLREFRKELEEREYEAGRPLAPWEEKELLDVARAQVSWKRRGYIPPPPF